MADKAKTQDERGRELLYQALMWVSVVAIMVNLALTLWDWPGWYAGTVQQIALISTVFVFGLGMGGMAEQRCRRQDLERL